jgi:mycofactocin system creatininase family protein
VPVGATEQHGPHLPLATDTRIAAELVARLTQARADVWAAPALPYGASGEHAGFPGTLSIGADALEEVLVELGRSADHFAGLILVNGHGGNAEPVARAARRLAGEGRRCLAWAPSRPPAEARWDGHGGFVETSIALALGWPEVRMELAAPGNTAALADLAGQLRAGGVAAVSSSGVLGDPTAASASDGERLLRAFADDLVSRVAAWVAGSAGRLGG